MTVADGTVLGLHHFAWRCRDAEETRHFYEDVIGLPLVHVIRLDRVPSTGEHCPYVHIFFRMADGSCIAFFDLGDGRAAAPSPNTPEWVNHIALRVASLEALDAMRRRLVAHGLSVLGPTDHGMCVSIYFFDPNGLRVEFTVATETDDEARAHRLRARADLDAWTAGRYRGTGPNSPT